MPRLTSKQLQKYIEEAYQAWYAEREAFHRKFDSIPISETFDWQYQPGGNRLSLKLKKQTYEETKSLLRARMEAVNYPYPPEEGKTPKTLFSVVQSRNLLDVVFDSEVIRTVHFIWAFRHRDRVQDDLRKNQQSAYGYPRKFHRAVLKELARHLEFLDKQVADNYVPADWFSAYRAALLKALLREATIEYPDFPRSFTPANKMSATKQLAEFQYQLFETIRRAVPKQQTISDNLGFYLVAVVFSDDDYIRRHQFSPMPQAVASNLRSRMPEIKSRKQKKKRRKKPQIIK